MTKPFKTLALLVSAVTVIPVIAIDPKTIQPGDVVGASVLHAVDNDETGVIPNASYYIYEGNEGDRPYRVTGVLAGTKHVTFYTFDGDKLKTTEYSAGQCEAVKKRLDPAAPKPQPTAYSIKYWECWIGFGYKGVPGHFIVFHDKHGNQIENFRFEQHKTDMAEFSQHLDLSLLSFDDINKRYADSQEVEKQVKASHRCF